MTVLKCLAAVTNKFAGDRRSGEGDELMLDPTLHELADMLRIDPQQPGLDLLCTAATVYSMAPHKVSSAPFLIDWRNCA